MNNSVNTTKRKITEISVFEFFICMFVILIHLLSEGTDVFPKWSGLSVVFFSLTKLMTFAVPGFVFTSAIKQFYKYGGRKFNYPKFLLGRFLKVYIPYVVAVCIYYAVFVYVLDLDGFDSFDFRQLLGFILRGDISAQFYFVILIVQFYVLMPLWILMGKSESNVLGISLIAVSLLITILSRMFFVQASSGIVTFLSGLKLPFANPFAGMDTTQIKLTLGGYTNKVFTSYLVFWVAGMYIGMNYDKFAELVQESRPVIYIGWLVLALSHCILSYMQFAGLIRYSFEPVIVVFFCLFSIFGFYLYADGLTVSLEKMGKGVLTSIAGASYDIYLIHCLIITIVYYYLGHIEVESTLQRFWTAAGITYGFSIIFCGIESTIRTNIRLGMNRRSAARARKAARRKRYL